jgi:hypothetical protein
MDAQAYHLSIHGVPRRRTVSRKEAQEERSAVWVTARRLGSQQRPTPKRSGSISLRYLGTYDL